MLSCTCINNSKGKGLQSMLYAYRYSIGHFSNPIRILERVLSEAMNVLLK